MTPQMQNLREAAFLGGLIEKIFTIAHDIENDEQYTKEDSVNDLIDLANEIRSQIAMKNF